MDDQATPPAPAQHQPHQSHSALIAIITAIILALALVGLGYLAFRASGVESNPDNKKAPTITTSDEETTEPADSAAVETSANAVDEELDELSDEDFNEDDLSDDSLGL